MREVRHVLYILFGIAIILNIYILFNNDAIAANPSRGTIAYCNQNAANENVRKMCIIRVVFRGTGASRKAISIARCESGINPAAVNGQYRGAWQVSADLRRKYRGFGRTIERQTWHVKRIWNDSGWQHWIGFGCA